jgi:VWFA-related protein
MKHCVIALSTLMAAHAITAAQHPVFRARTDLVRVATLVTKGRTPVAGLGVHDFEVFDNGVRQDLDGVLTEQASIDAVLVLDESGSVRKELPDLVTASDAFLDRLTSRDRGHVLSVRASVSRLEPGQATLLTRDRDPPRAAGYTSLRDALALALAMRDPAFERAMVLVLSDGFDTMSWLREEQVLASAKRSDAVIYAVLARTPNEREGPLFGATPDYLGTLAHETGGRVIATDPGKDLSTMFGTVLEEMRARYVLTFYPKGVSRTGWHELKVKVKRRGARVLSRRGYFAASVATPG